MLSRTNLFRLKACSWLILFVFVWLNLCVYINDLFSLTGPIVSCISLRSTLMVLQTTIMLCKHLIPAPLRRLGFTFILYIPISCLFFSSHLSVWQLPCAVCQKTFSKCQCQLKHDSLSPTGKNYPSFKFSYRYKA